MNSDLLYIIYMLGKRGVTVGNGETKIFPSSDSMVEVEKFKFWFWGVCWAKSCTSAEGRDPNAW